MLLIPFEPNIETIQRTVLDGVECRIRIYWEEINPEIQSVIAEENTEYEGFYYLDLVSEKFTITGIRLVTGCNLLQPYALTDFGQLYIVPRNTTDVSDVIRFDSLGSDQLIVYVEAANVTDV